MTSLLERVPVDGITAQARDVHPGRTLLTVLAAVLFGIGWAACKTAAVVWLACAWTFVAAREGWREARRSAVTGGAGRPR